MLIRVLGCYGSEYPGCRTTCFLINNTLAVDAGAMTSSLTLKEQARIDHILLTHAHLDHVLDIGFLADNVIGRKSHPVKVIGTNSTIGVLMGNVLNNRIWPDFTLIPTAKNPVLAIRKIKHNTAFKLNNLNIRAVPVSHTVPTVGFIIQENNGGSIVFSGDTGPTKKLWQAADRLKNLKAIFIELSFPNRFQKRADASHHLTPQTLDAELEKIKSADKTPVFLYHMKPHYIEEIKREIKALKRPNVKILSDGKRLTV